MLKLLSIYLAIYLWYIVIIVCQKHMYNSKKKNMTIFASILFSKIHPMFLSLQAIVCVDTNILLIISFYFPKKSSKSPLWLLGTHGMPHACQRSCIFPFVHSSVLTLVFPYCFLCISQVFPQFYHYKTSENRFDITDYICIFLSLNVQQYRVYKSDWSMFVVINYSFNSTIVNIW